MGLEGGNTAPNSNDTLNEFLDDLPEGLKPEERSVIQRTILSQDIAGHDPENAVLEYKQIILNLIVQDKFSVEANRLILQQFAENSIMSELYAQYGVGYRLGATSGATDCVQILRQSETFRAALSSNPDYGSTSNPIRFFSEGSDLVLDESFGRVVNVVDREDFEDLSKYKPDEGKMYVFGLVKPPLYFGGKPNISHLQIPTDLNTAPGQLAVIHASADKGTVVVESDLQEYFLHKKFERVYVIEIDLEEPHSNSLLEREPFFSVPDHEGRRYSRPHMSILPVILDEFTITRKSRVPYAEYIPGKATEYEMEVPIYDEEKRVLELITPDNRVMEYLTILTGIREGKIGEMSNVLESTAYDLHDFAKEHPVAMNPVYVVGAGYLRENYDPADRSIGLHQVTRIVHPLFNEWLQNLDERTARQIGYEVEDFWERAQMGKEITWTEIVPHLDTYEDGAYQEDTHRVSTICSYLLLNHLYEDQIMTAYENYGETFHGLEEQPEAIIAISAAYRSNIDVMVTGGQQYRIAELAYQFDLIDADFNFTDKAKKLSAYDDFIDAVNESYEDIDEDDPLKQSFLVDGYRGVQAQYMAYMCYQAYKDEANNGYNLSFTDFEDAYGSSQRAMLSMDNPAVAFIRNTYESELGHAPKLLMTEEELRDNTKLQNHIITFANEGLWVSSYMRKLSSNNWDAITAYSETDANKFNTYLEDVLEERSLRTNEVSKLPYDVTIRFGSLISQLPSDAWYTDHPQYLMSLAFTSGLVGEAIKYPESERWLEKTRHIFDDCFIKFKKNIEEQGIALPDNEAQAARLLMMLYVHYTQEINVYAEGTTISERFTDKHWEDLPGLINLFDSDVMDVEILSQTHGKAIYRADTYARSFERLPGGYHVKDGSVLEVKEELNEREKREKFTLEVYDAAYNEAMSRGYSIDFALVATSMAALECGWGREENEWGEPTLYSAANNIFSIKADYEQYTKVDFETQEIIHNSPILDRSLEEARAENNMYIHHTKEYFEDSDEYTEHYEAFRSYDSIQHSVEDFFDLMEKGAYSDVIAIVDNPALLDVELPNTERQADILNELAGTYATDPNYTKKVLSVSNSVQAILRKYGQLI